MTFRPTFAVDPLQLFARLGFAARGFTYLLVGWFALAAAVGGAQPRGSAELFGTLLDETTGRLLLLAISSGFACYGLWQMLEALLRLGGPAADQRRLFRVGRTLGGLLHLLVATYAGLLSVGIMALEGTAELGRPSPVRDWTAWLITLPFGAWMLGAIGAAVIAWGLGQLGHARRADFKEELQAAPRMLHLIELVGRLGFAARGVVLLLVGGLLLWSAWLHDASASGGIGFALRKLQAQPAGPWLLALIAAGLALFGVYGILDALFRRVDKRPIVLARLIRLFRRLRGSLATHGERSA